MHVESTAKVPQQPVEMEGSQGCRVRWLLGENVGAANFAMREFEVAPGGHTPRHQHPYEHEVYVLQGHGEVIDGEEPRALAPGDVIYVAEDDVHQFKNTGDETMKFLCLIPNSATGKTVTVVPECGIEPG
ncbi:cupin domain-containing protein [Pirellulales bacterium]|nr:cupin domain-containing protein [Pirellulales bacterium]